MACSRNPLTLAAIVSLWLASVGKWPLWRALGDLPELASVRGALFIQSALRSEGGTPGAMRPARVTRAHGSDIEGEECSMDEFEDDAYVARLPMTAKAAGETVSRQRLAIARVVSRVYRAANGAVRADMLVHLLRPLGVLGLVSVASGAFARLVRRDSLVPDTIPAEDMVRYSSEQIRELTIFVHEVNPDALQPLIEQMAQNALGVAALSTAALVMLHRGSRGRSALLRKTDSSVHRTIGNRRWEEG